MKRTAALDPNDVSLDKLRVQIESEGKVFKLCMELLNTLLEGQVNQEIASLMTQQLDFDILINCAVLIYRIYIHNRKEALQLDLRYNFDQI